MLTPPPKLSIEPCLWNYAKGLHGHSPDGAKPAKLALPAWNLSVRRGPGHHAPRCNITIRPPNTSLDLTGNSN